MDTVHVEIASRPDLEEILSLQKEAYLSEAAIYNDFTIPPLTQSIKEVEEEYNKGLFLKTVYDGTIIGSVRAYQCAGVCHIGKLIVKPGFQNKGIGGELLCGIESRFLQAKTFELFTGHKSYKNLHLYQKYGYVISYHMAVSPSLTMVFLRKHSTSFD